MKALPMLGIALCAALCAAGAEPPVKCVSHRGEERDAPEASRPAFVLAAQRRAMAVRWSISRYTVMSGSVPSTAGALIASTSSIPSRLPPPW